MHTFETFLGCDAARDAARAVVESPGRVHNPLILKGPSGSGKTHLLHAIANALPDRNVRHLSADALATQLVDAIRSHEIAQFRESFIGLDALLIDDLRLSPDRVRRLTEIFRIVDEAVARGVQVVIAPDRSTFPLTSPRAFVARLAYPDERARVAILRNAAAQHHLVIPDGVLMLLAKRPHSAPKLQAEIARLALTLGSGVRQPS